MRNYLLSCLVVFFNLVAIQSVSAQVGQHTWGYEYRGEIPVYVDSIHNMLTYPFAYRHYGDKAGWKDAARYKVLECMGERPPLPHDWDMEILASEKRDGYKAMRIEFSLSSWYRVRAYLLVPEGDGRFPAVNLLHDHGAHLSIGKEKMIRPFAVDTAVVTDADSWVSSLYEGQYLGDYLARHGYVVFSCDAPLWGERGRKEGVDRKKYDIIAGNMMMLGVDLCAFMHYDDMASTDFLASLPYVDSERIGAAGCSMGAYRAWMLSALSDRVRAACSVCWMVTTPVQLTTEYGRKENGGFANCIPMLRRFMDYPDIASIAAPKPAMFISGNKDKLFPVKGVQDAFKIMDDVWKAKNGAANLETYILDQPHECNRKDQQMILDFFDRHL